MFSIATLMRILTPSLEAGTQATPQAQPAPDKDELVTVATYDKITDAHIALGRLTAEGITAQLFDDQMAQMYSIALGGIKLRVARGDEKAAREVLATDYSTVLDDADLGKQDDQ